MISKKELLNILKKKGMSYDSSFLTSKELHLDYFEIDDEFKKSFNKFFKENKITILKKLIILIAPKEIIDKYKLNDFLLSVAIKMYENNHDLFKKNAKAVGASDDELIIFDGYAERARNLFDVDNIEFKETMKRYVDLINNLLKDKIVRILNIRKTVDSKIDIDKVENDLELNKDCSIYKKDKEYLFSIDLIVEATLEKENNETLINEALENLINSKSFNKDQYLILYK